MTELSLHILDIIENSVSAGAKNIKLSINEDLTQDLYSIEITDNGKGMNKEEIQNSADPFFTSRTTRKVGLGLPLFKLAAEQSNGSLNIESQPGKGTSVKAVFELSHIDRQPLGDIAGVICMIIKSYPGIDLIYEHKTNYGKYKIDTVEIRKIIEDMPLNDIKIIRFLKEMIIENLVDIKISA